MKKMLMMACAMACAAFMVGCGKSSIMEEMEERMKREQDPVYRTKVLEQKWTEACDGSPDAIKALREGESRCWRQIDSAGNVASFEAEGVSPDDQKDGFELADDNFRYISGKIMPEALEKVRPDATLMDLYDFAHVVCYNNHLSSRLQTNKPLTRHDLQLLRFVLDVTSSTIVAMSASLLGDMVFDQKPNNVKPNNFALQALSKDHAALAEYIKSFAEAPKFRITIREQIQSFASRFSDVAYEQKFGTFGRVDLSSVVAGPRFYLTQIGDEECMKIKGYKELGDEWGRLCDAAERYLKFYARIYKELNSYSPVKSWSKRAVVNLLEESGACRDKTVSTYCLAFYDVPFVLVLYRTRCEYKRCKDILNDDEEGMENALIRLNQAIGGTRILQHVETAFALDLYATCIADIKGEMSESEFTTIKTKTGLTAKASKSNRFDSETGLPLNNMEVK